MILFNVKTVATFEQGLSEHLFQSILKIIRRATVVRYSDIDLSAVFKFLMSYTYIMCKYVGLFIF